MDMTYQRKDRETTDDQGFATLTVATNSSQRMILGWTYGVFPWIAVTADGYSPRDIGIPKEASERSEPLLISIDKTDQAFAK
jgi:hypothetical protein